MLMYVATESYARRFSVQCDLRLGDESGEGARVVEWEMLRCELGY